MAQTAAARAANSARNHPTIIAHDALVLPTIAILRRNGFSRSRIAREFDGVFDPPGRARRFRPGTWHAAAVLRIAGRHRAALRDAGDGVNGSWAGHDAPARLAEGSR